MLVYFHRNPTTYEIFYVGIASESGRAQRPYQKSNRNKYWHHTINKYGFPIVQIAIADLSKKDACKWERFYISLLGKKIDGGQLVNLSDGGETNAGYKQSESQRELSRQRALKNGVAHMKTPEAEKKRALSYSTRMKGVNTGAKNPNFGKRWTDEMKKSLSEKKKGKPYTGDRANLSIASKRMWCDPEYRNKIVPIAKKALAEYWSQNRHRYKENFALLDKKKMYDSMVESHGRKLICTKTGKVFPTIVSSANSIGMNEGTLRCQLNGKSKAKTTSFEYYLPSATT